jgi:hypothetical protein
MSEQRLRAKIGKHERYAPAEADLDVRTAGCARLPGWRFVLDLYSARQACLVADIVQGDDRDEVWGVLYELDAALVSRSDGRRSVLDRIEGHRTELDPENYRPITVAVEIDGELRDSHTYVGREDARERCRRDHSDATPRPDYLGAIMDGAESAGLPAAYVRALGTTLRAWTGR